MRVHSSKPSSRRSPRNRSGSETLDTVLRRLAAEETGAVIKPFSPRASIALAYPNTYQAGMSSLGFQSLAGRVNRRSGASCERMFWKVGAADEANRPPLTIENRRPLRDFPLAAFSISFEMDYLHFLEILHRSGVPLRWSDRGEDDPVVLCGGKAPTMNRSPIYDFVDLFVHGDGEEAMDWIVDDLEAGGGRAAILDRLAARPGFEAPPLIGGSPDGEPPPPPAPLALADRLDEFPCHSTILTPNTELASRALIEISRGCPYKCAFCIMGYQPDRYRRRTPDDVLEMARLFKPHTNRVGLVASAVGIHRGIDEICEGLDALGMDVSFSSLRVEDVKPSMVRSLLRSGQRMLTIAPETGNENLRRRILKNLSDARIEEFAEWSLREGMESLKLYYMIGIPGESDDDVLSIAAQVRRLREIHLRVARPRGAIGQLVLNVGVFVPKPGTPLAEGGFRGVAEARRRIRMLGKALSGIPNLKVHFESPREAGAQARLALGGRGEGRHLERAVLEGKRIPVLE